MYDVSASHSYADFSSLKCVTVKFKQETNYSKILFGDWPQKLSVLIVIPAIDHAISHWACCL